MSNKTIFDEIGGDAGVNKVVDSFYNKMIADDRINKLFEDIYLPILISHQRAFIKFSLDDGDSGYTGKPLREAHATLVDKKGLNDFHFDVVKELFEESLNEANIQEEKKSEIIEFIETTRKEVLNL